MLVIFLGVPGAGKGTQAGLVAKKYNLGILSTGQILRNAVNEKTKLGIQVKDIMSSGSLVPDDIICPIMENELKKKTSHNGYILDGFPRTVYQAHKLEDIIINNHFAEPYIISLNLGKEETLKRLSSRIFCKNCNQSYSSITKNGEIRNKCDVCGHVHFYKREDDKKDVIKVRFSAYTAQTSLLDEYYKTCNCYVDIDASQDITTIHNETVSFIEKTKLAL